MRAIHLTVNGKLVATSIAPRTHLADFLRDTLNLTGTHLGCEHGVCGACTLLIDGAPARSCITLAVACEGASITTIEGLDDDPLAQALREAFSREHALQCGYCTPGMLAAARDTVLRLPRATERDIRVAMSGNLCRCTGYVGIVRAIQRVAAARATRGLSAPRALERVLGPVGSGHAVEAIAARAAAPLPAPGGTAPAEALQPAIVAMRTDTPVAAKPQTTLRQVFSVNHPRERVWEFFGRLGEVTTCLPGASLLRAPSDDQVEARVRVKAGPIIAEFEGDAHAARDALNHAGTIHGSARDARSNSAARGEIRYVLVEDNNGASTRVEVDVSFTITGPLAQFGRSGIVQDVGRRMTDAFAQNLRMRMSDGADVRRGDPAPAAELNAGALVLSVLWSRIKARLHAWFGR